MKSKIKGWLIGLVVLFILMIPIISDYYKNKDIEVINFASYTDIFQDENFHVVYYGNPEADTYATLKNDLITLRNDFEIKIKTLNLNKLSDSEKNSLMASENQDKLENGYIFIKDSSVVYNHEGNLDKEELEVLINKYYNNIIPEDEIAYKVAKDYKEYKKAIDSKKVIMSVFGRSSCYYCNLYEPVYNDLAAEHDIPIYHFDSDIYNQSEYSKILNSGLKIPKSCTDTGKDESLASPFGTPLTLFTKNGKVIDCISGYVDAAGLTKKLQDVGMIK